MPHRLTAETIDSEEALRALLGEPLPVVVSKITDRLNAATRRFVELSPFVCMATADGAGTCDVSPRGACPGVQWTPQVEQLQAGVRIRQADTSPVGRHVNELPRTGIGAWDVVVLERGRRGQDPGKLKFSADLAVDQAHHLVRALLSGLYYKYDGRSKYFWKLWSQPATS